MPKPPHKHAGLGLRGSTALGKTDLAALAQSAADEAHGNAWNSPGKVRFEKAAPDRLDFSVRSPAPLNRESLTFAVTTKTNGERTDIQVRIIGYKTSQPTVMLIPLGSKKMLGLAAYRSYLELLEANLHAADPTASTHAVGLVP